MLYILHNIRLNWANKKVTQGLFLDLSSAFEKVWHNGLLAKLSQVGVEGSFYDLLSSYLTDRRQVVVVDGQKSETLEIKQECPRVPGWGPCFL